MLQIRTYFLPNNMKATKEEIQLIFKLRCRMTDMKTNMKGKGPCNPTPIFQINNMKRQS